jgi:hypothetical protein
VSNEASFSFTTKINGGTDLFTVRGDTYDEFTANLMNAYNNVGVRMLLDTLNGNPEADAIATITNTLGGTVVAQPAPAFQPAVAANVTPAPPANPTPGGGRACVHGQMIAKQGTGKDGKTWRGYMCASPQGATDKCKNVYIYPNMPEWHTFVAS